MGTEGLLSSRVLKLLLWVQLSRELAVAQLVTVALSYAQEFVRLVEGKRRCSGRVEIRDGDQWKAVCDSQFGPKAADVVCRELQCGTALPITGAAHFGEGFSPRPSVLGLRAVLTGPVSVFEGAVEVRLADGGKPCAGRVEVKHQGRWGTVCDDNWNIHDAAVVCKQLDCGSAVGAPQYGHFGGSGPVWMDDVGCNGTKSALSDCKHGGWGEHDCDHSLDAGVMCSEYTGFRLVNGSTACEGRVEVQVLGTWGTLCASRWDLSDAHVLCRQLNCGFAESIPGGEHFGREPGPVWTDSFHCDGTEAHLTQCQVITLGASPCSHGNNTAVICSGDFASLRLGGGSRCDGRVEILQRGTWGRVRDEEWDMQEASVVCRQLQCGEAGRAYNPPKPERGTGPSKTIPVECGSLVPDPTQVRPTGSGRVSLPIIICIILGALCLLLALLAGQVLSARARRRGSRRAWEPFPEAVYEEIGYSPAWKKQVRFGRSGSYSEESLTQLQPYPGDGKEEDGLGSAPDVVVLPGVDPADGYDDAREVSDPGEDGAPGQRELEMTRVPEEGAGPRDAPRDVSHKVATVALNTPASPRGDHGLWITSHSG
ncbi:LOW QUALITY PROTEIN: scavenger receptor cysteine-rich type 1 protein M130-like [Phoenicopterus ruber ruber]